MRGHRQKKKIFRQRFLSRKIPPPGTVNLPKILQKGWESGAGNGNGLLMKNRNRRERKDRSTVSSVLVRRFQSQNPIGSLKDPKRAFQKFRRNPQFCLRRNPKGISSLQAQPTSFLLLIPVLNLLNLLSSLRSRRHLVLQRFSNSLRTTTVTRRRPPPIPISSSTSLYPSTSF